MFPRCSPTRAEWIGFDDTGEIGIIRFVADATFTNRHGTIQGGFLAAMLDSATGVRALAGLSSWTNRSYHKPEHTLS